MREPGASRGGEAVPETERTYSPEHKKERSEANGRRFPSTIRNAMTVDVEEHFQVSNFEESVSRQTWDHSPSRVFENTVKLLDLFDEADVQATFFILGWVAERRPELVKRIADAGHEVASHGHSHRLIYTQTPREFREELTRSKDLLEQAGGVPVSGHRAASFSIGRTNLWALDIVAECGFHYDSSVFPVLHHRYGVPGAPRGLYRLATPAGHQVVEVPPSTIQVGRWALPIGGGGYLRLFPASLSRWAVRRLNHKERRPAVIYVHPWEVDPDQPRINNVKALSRFRHYVNLHSTAKKLRSLMASFSFTTARDVVREAGELATTRLT